MSLIYTALFVLASLIISCSSEIFAIKFSIKHNLFDSVNERKIHHGQIARIGSIGFAVPFFVLGIAAFFYLNSTGTASVNNLLVWGFFASSFIIFISGLIDDICELKAFTKLGLQIFAAVTAVVFFFFYAKYNSDFFANTPVVVIFVLLAFFVFILGSINSYNLIDGSDLLCSSLSLFSIIAFGIIFKDTNYPFFVFCLILGSALLGFMYFNRPDARIFMGDGGSQFLGIVMAYLSVVLISSEGSLLLSHLICVNLVSIPCMDCIAAIWRRLRKHIGIFHADRFHMHHKLLNLGLSKGKIALFISVIQIIIAASAVFSYYFQSVSLMVSVCVQIVVFIMIILYFVWLHFASHKNNPEEK